MAKSKSANPVVSVLILLLIVGLMGCSTTRRTTRTETQVEDVADIDELLGLTDDQSNEEPAQETIAEDDVLKLLGVTEAESASPSRAGESSSELERQIQEYEDDRAALVDRERNLRDTITQQEQTLSVAEAQPPVTTQPSRSETQLSRQGASFPERYQEALQAYRSHRYREAVQMFEALLNTNNRHSLSDNCQYWIGESYYGLGNYHQAITAFQNVFTFSDSNKDDAAQLKLGLCYMRLNETDQAKQEFQKLIDNYPTSEFVGIARRYIAQTQ